MVIKVEMVERRKGLYAHIVELLVMLQVCAINCIGIPQVINQRENLCHTRLATIALEISILKLFQ